jgi:hypothetical protein
MADTLTVNPIRHLHAALTAHAALVSTTPSGASQRAILEAGREVAEATRAFAGLSVPELQDAAADLVLGREALGAFDLAESTETAVFDDRDRLRTFAGFLAANVPELTHVEIPRLNDAVEAFYVHDVARGFVNDAFLASSLGERSSEAERGTSAAPSLAPDEPEPSQTEAAGSSPAAPSHDEPVGEPV